MQTLCRCGAQVAAEYRYCPKCGAEVHGPDDGDNAKPTESGNRRSRRAVWWAGDISTAREAGDLWAEEWLDVATAREMTDYAGTATCAPIEDVTECTTKVAVIDSAIDRHHKELQDVVTAVNDERPQLNADGRGGSHGTAMASLIAAQDDSVGVTRMAEHVEILSAPFSSLIVPEGAPEDFDPESLAEQVRWSVDHGADVLNMSILAACTDDIRSYDTEDPATWWSCENENLRQAITYARMNGVSMVAASGNLGTEGNPEVFPAAFDGVISVASHDRDGERSWFSSANPTVDLAAPGDAVLAAGFSGSVDEGPVCVRTEDIESYGYGDGEDLWCVQWGTSHAAAYTSATIAWLLNHVPNATPSEIEQALYNGAISPEGQEPGTRTDEFGYGYLSPVDALKVRAEIQNTDDDGSGPDTLAGIALWDGRGGFGPAELVVVHPGTGDVLATAELTGGELKRGVSISRRWFSPDRRYVALPLAGGLDHPETVWVGEYDEQDGRYAEIAVIDGSAEESYNRAPISYTHPRFADDGTLWMEADLSAEREWELASITMSDLKEGAEPTGSGLMVPQGSHYGRCVNVDAHYERECEAWEIGRLGEPALRDSDQPHALYGDQGDAYVWLNEDGEVAAAEVFGVNGASGFWRSYEGAAACDQLGWTGERSVLVSDCGGSALSLAEFDIAGESVTFTEILPLPREGNLGPVIVSADQSEALLEVDDEWYRASLDEGEREPQPLDDSVEAALVERQAYVLDWK